MRFGMLSEHFVGAVAKQLTLVETITDQSNQHEFQGIQPFRALLGLEDRRRIPTRFIRLDDESPPLSQEGFLSWSNVRKGKPRAAEYHLYYSTNAVTEVMAIDDLMILALRADGRLLCLITPPHTSTASQLLWLFGLEAPTGRSVTVSHLQEGHDTALGFAARQILEQLEIEVDEPQDDHLDALIEPFGTTFPKTKVFSDLARTSLPEVSAADDADLALSLWIEREEQLFRRLERRIVAQRIEQGFLTNAGTDVDGFIGFSLSVQNRRKSRVGHALENHLEAVFQAQGLAFARGAMTENRNRPDFLFPGPVQYADSTFPAERLTMLGAKSTLKDRWRQVLSEAERIPNKHLLTLEPSISENQTDEMQAKHLQLVVPRLLHETFKPKQQAWLMDINAFTEMVRQRCG